MPHLAVSRIAKTYDGNPAVRDISFEVEPGRVLALCGENGAGKSTLMKMLSGATRPDSGEIRLDDHPVEIASPSDAMALGIRTVYQELSLLPHLSVAENMLLGSHADASAFLRGRLGRGQPHRRPRACRFRVPRDRSDCAWSDRSALRASRSSKSPRRWSPNRRY